jgi:hypothetical protein
MVVIVVVKVESQQPQQAAWWLAGGPVSQAACGSNSACPNQWRQPGQFLQLNGPSVTHSVRNNSAQSNLANPLPTHLSQPLMCALSNSLDLTPC